MGMPEGDLVAAVCFGGSALAMARPAAAALRLPLRPA